MLIKDYNKVYNEYFNSAEFENDFVQTLDLLKDVKRIFFIGNGGSMAICSHMMEDYAKIARFQTFAFSDAALITCYSNDYGYEQAMKEWLKLYLEPRDLLVAISSSGNSMNINNAVDYANEIGSNVVTLSGFGSQNALRGKGKVNFYIASQSYGIVECFHQVILHSVLDEYAINQSLK